MLHLFTKNETPIIIAEIPSFGYFICYNKELDPEKDENSHRYGKKIKYDFIPSNHMQ
jgi:hypothetical protein